METTKICTKCNIEKSITEFSFRKDTNKYRNQCKECRKIQNNQYFKDNKETILEKNKIYYDKNKDHISQVNKEYKNKEKKKWLDYKRKYRLDNIEHIRAYQREYNKTDKAKAGFKNASAKRRTQKKHSDITSEYLLNLQEKAKTCYWCTNKLEKSKTHIDHYIPLSRGGTHTKDNIVVSCSSCNLSKNSKSPYAFAMSKGKLL